MEIQQNLHAGIFGAANRALHVGKRAVLAGGRMPQTNAHEIGAPLGEKDKGVHDLPVFAVHSAAVFHFVDVGEIGAQKHRGGGGNRAGAVGAGVAGQGTRKTIRSLYSPLPAGRYRTGPVADDPPNPGT